MPTHHLRLAAVLMALPWGLEAQLQQPIACRAGTPGDPVAILSRARTAAGIDRVGAGALHLKVSEMVSQDFQSDRTYPPYLFEGRTGERWYFPSRALEFVKEEALDPFGARPVPATWSTAEGTWMVRDTATRPVPQLHRFDVIMRPLNAWAVLADWSSGPTPTASGSCMVRDFPRVSLVRQVDGQSEQLFLDPKTGLPIQYQRLEADPTALWGQVEVSYVYANWFGAAGGLYPMASYRIVNGETQVIRTAAALATGDVPAIPAGLTGDPMPSSVTWPAEAPDTIRVSERTWLLKTRYYTNTITLVRDTVFVLDAQWTGEARVRADSTWIATLFPGRHPVVVVVSDLAWPHIAGVRTWVAMGATVVAHRSAESFLRKVVDHRWTRSPDLLEKRRAKARFRLRVVEDSASFGGGAVRVYPINGIGSEGSLMTWLPEDHFLFAGDYVQGLDGPSQSYTREVFDAVTRVGVQPERFAAMHFPLTPWNKLVTALTAPAS